MWEIFLDKICGKFSILTFSISIARKTYLHMIFFSILKISASFLALIMANTCVSQSNA